MIPRELYVHEYTKILMAWGVTAGLDLSELGLLLRVCWEVIAKFEDGERHDVDELCTYALSLEAGRPLHLTVHKSCLLDRLLYGGENVRTEMCPVHKGRWSGCNFRDPCPHGCSYGSNVTGWVANK